MIINRLLFFLLPSNMKTFVNCIRQLFIEQKVSNFISSNDHCLFFEGGHILNLTPSTVWSVEE